VLEDRKTEKVHIKKKLKPLFMLHCNAILSHTWLVIIIKGENFSSE
jgi:hypothetical protein